MTRVKLRIMRASKSGTMNTSPFHKRINTSSEKTLKHYFIICIIGRDTFGIDIRYIRSTK